MPEEEQEAILGISEYERSQRLQMEGKFEEAEHYLKQALKILKNAQADQSMGYVYMLKRLAHLCFVSRKFSESEKFFRICADMSEKVTSNPINKF